MARTKQKGKSKGHEIRRVRTKKERGGGSVFTRLKTDEFMVGFALFTPDPEIDDNPGWFEYLEHYDNSNNQYVPCLGDDCYMCELGENPSTRALTLWYFPDAGEKDRLKVLKANGYLIRDFTEIDEEEGGVLGKKFRVKRLSDRGEYRVVPRSDKPLTKKQIKDLLKEIPELEKMMLKQAENALKKYHAVSALSEDDEIEDDDDDDDDEDEPKSSRRGKPKDEEIEDDDDDDDDDEDEDDDDDSDDDDGDDEDDDEDDDDDDEEDDEDEDEDDEEDDDDGDDDEDDDEDEDEDEEPQSLNSEKFSVVSVSEKDETITVKLEGKNTKLWVGEGVDVDFDVVKKGAEITVDAQMDSEGDWVIAKLTAKKPKASGGKAAPKGKTTRGGKKK